MCLLGSVRQCTGLLWHVRIYAAGPRVNGHLLGEAESDERDVLAPDPGVVGGPARRRAGDMEVPGQCEMDVSCE